MKNIIKKYIYSKFDIKNTNLSYFIFDIWFDDLVFLIKYNKLDDEIYFSTNIYDEIVLPFDSLDQKNIDNILNLDYLELDKLNKKHLYNISVKLNNELRLNKLNRLKKNKIY